MLDELYIPTSYIAKVKHNGAWYAGVEVDWVRPSRTAPIAPYPMLITDYTRLSAAERTDAEQYMDHLFTGDEYGLLRAYLAERSVEVGISVVPIPMEVKPASVGFIATPILKAIAHDQSGRFGWFPLDDLDGVLPFQVAGTYFIASGARPAGEATQAGQ